MNQRSTSSNIKLVEAAIVLNLYYKLMSADEVRHGINAYMLTCREFCVDLLPMNYDKV
jgi:hypothetical protein